MVGASAFSQPIRQAAHRPAIFARLAGVGWGSVITPEMVARVIAAEGLCDVIYVNQVDAPETALPGGQLCEGGGCTRCSRFVTDTALGKAVVKNAEHARYAMSIPSRVVM